MNQNANKLNLVPAIREIEAQIGKINREYKEKLAPYEESLAKLREINTACEVCGGEGKILRSRACAEDDRPDPNDPGDWVKCRKCLGTGLAHPDYPKAICFV